MSRPHTFDGLEVDYVREQGLAKFIKAPILGILVGEEAYSNELILVANRARCIQDAGRMITVETVANRTSPCILTHNSPFLNGLIALAQASNCSVVLAEEIWPSPTEANLEQAELVLSYGTHLWGKNVMVRTVKETTEIQPTTDVDCIEPYNEFKRISRGLQRWTTDPFPPHVIRVKQVIDLRPKY